MVTEAVVLSAGQSYLQVLVPSLGEDGRIYFEDQKYKNPNKKKEKKEKNEKKDKEKKDKAEKGQQVDAVMAQIDENRNKEEWEIEGSTYDDAKLENVVIWPGGKKQVLKTLSEVRVLVCAKSKGQLDVDILIILLLVLLHFFV